MHAQMISRSLQTGVAVHIPSRRASSCRPIIRLPAASAQIAALDYDLVPPAPERSSRNIVLAIDTDVEGRKALHYTLQHIYRPGDVLHLLHVVPASSNLLSQGQCLAYTLPPEEGLQEQMTDRARQYFEQHYMAVAQQSGADVQLDLVHGNCRHSVTNTICQKVQDLAAELVVLTVQRKRSFIEELFQAPIGKQLAEVCPCPTLIIPDACS